MAQKIAFSAFVSAVLFALALSIPTHALAADSVTLKYVHLDPPTGVVHLYHQLRWAEEIERRTEGRVKIRVYPAQQLGKASEFYDMVVAGVADIAWMVTGFNPGRFPMSSVADLPFFAPSGHRGSQILNALYHRGYFDKDFPDVKLLNVAEPSPYFLWSNKKVTKLEDLKGLKVRAYGNYPMKTLNKMGMVPTQMPGPDVYMGLTTGTIDGTGASYTIASFFKWNDATKFANEDVYIPVGAVAEIMNKKSWAKLSPKDQRILEIAFLEKGLDHGSFYDYAGGILKNQAISKGVEITKLPDQDVKKMRASLEPLYDEWAAEMDKKGLPGTRMIKDLRALREKMGFGLQ